jgi:hypothetical protein
VALYADLTGTRNCCKRPGIYTVLGGEPNRWPQSKVDFNLRQLRNSRAFQVGPFDPESIMKYHFGAWMFRAGERSHCFSPPNTILSEQDKRGMLLAYPHSQEEINNANQQQRRFLERLLEEQDLQPEKGEPGGELIHSLQGCMLIQGAKALAWSDIRRQTSDVRLLPADRANFLISGVLRPGSFRRRDVPQVPGTKDRP